MILAKKVLFSHHRLYMGMDCPFFLEELNVVTHPWIHFPNPFSSPLSRKKFLDLIPPPLSPQTNRVLHIPGCFKLVIKAYNNFFSWKNFILLLFDVFPLVRLCHEFRGKIVFISIFTMLVGNSSVMRTIRSHWSLIVVSRRSQVPFLKNVFFIHQLLPDPRPCKQKCVNNGGTFLQESYIYIYISTCQLMSSGHPDIVHTCGRVREKQGRWS